MLWGATIASSLDQIPGWMMGAIVLVVILIISFGCVVLWDLSGRMDSVRSGKTIVRFRARNTSRKSS